MDADFLIELGREDPAPDFPWTDPAGKFAYVDLKRCPELMARIEEAEEFPELGNFLRAMNSARSMVETAKCDAWATRELSAEKRFTTRRTSLRVMWTWCFPGLTCVYLFPLTNSLPGIWLSSCGGRRRLRRRRRCACGGATSGRKVASVKDLLHLVCERLRQQRRQRASELGRGLTLMGNAIMQLSAGGVGL